MSAWSQPIHGAACIVSASPGSDTGQAQSTAAMVSAVCVISPVAAAAAFGQVRNTLVPLMEPWVPLICSTLTSDIKVRLAAFQLSINCHTMVIRSVLLGGM
jgi:hypothetical protein